MKKQGRSSGGGAGREREGAESSVCDDDLLSGGPFAAATFTRSSSIIPHVSWWWFILNLSVTFVSAFGIYQHFCKAPISYNYFINVAMDTGYAITTYTHIQLGSVLLLVLMLTFCSNSFLTQEQCCTFTFYSPKGSFPENSTWTLPVSNLVSSTGGINGRASDDILMSEWERGSGGVTMEGRT